MMKEVCRLYITLQCVNLQVTAYDKRIFISIRYIIYALLLGII